MLRWIARCVALSLGLYAFGVARADVGDVNGDSRINVKDVIRALQYAEGLRAPNADQLRRADVYPVVGTEGRALGDGRVTLADALRLLRYLTGRITRADLTGEIRVDTLAGSGAEGWFDGPGASARFSYPWTLGLDAEGNVYVADAYNGALRKVSPEGAVTTLAGDRSTPGRLKIGYRDGPADRARFNKPEAVAVGDDGTVYIADAGNHVIRQLKDGVVSTLAGNGQPGFRDGRGTDAQFREPTALLVANHGLYVGDTSNHAVRRVEWNGTVTTIAGGGTRGYTDGPALEAAFVNPDGLAFDEAGRLYIMDCGNLFIRRLENNGRVTTWAGDGHNRAADGPIASASFILPMQLDFDASGNLYVGDWGAQAVRRISPDGWMKTIAGTPGQYGFRDGTGAQALFIAPMGVVVDRRRNIAYVADTDNQRIRRIFLPRP